MTAVLLDIVFSLALARAFLIPLSKLLSVPHSILPSQCNDSHVPVLGSNNPLAGTGMKLQGGGSGVEGSSNCSCQKLSKGQSEVAFMVDAFMATYSAAYRSEQR